MAVRLVNVDRETPMLLPVDLKDWVPEDDLVHFVISAIETMKLPAMRVNRRGSGSKQYPPTMMLTLLVYCYSMGIFSSRRIQRATYRDLGVRYLTGNTHPDHDTICAFRRDNGQLVKEAMVEVLRLAREMKLLKIGTVAVDGTHIKANASKHKSVRYDRAGELEQQLRLDVEELLAKAEASDCEGGGDDEGLPEEIACRERLRERMLEARQRLEQRAQEQAAELDRARQKSGKGPQSPPNSKPMPKDSDQINLTDPQSALMRKSRSEGYQQAYNAQAVVDAEGSQLILGTDVVRTPSDANQLKPALECVPEGVGEVQRALADAGGMGMPRSSRSLKSRLICMWLSQLRTTATGGMTIGRRRRAAGSGSQIPACWGCGRKSPARLAVVSTPSEPPALSRSSGRSRRHWVCASSCSVGWRRCASSGILPPWPTT